MSNVVDYIIRISTRGGDNVDAIRDKTEKLNGVAGKVTGTFGKMLKSASLIGSLSLIVKGVGKAIRAYDEQSVFETKLTQVMRNTQRATNASVRSILDLASAQQEMGVVGADAQIAGAQELATYLKKTSSLKKLLPVMGDMLAQQYGVNASQEQAVSVAQMMGKVMDGQVGALSRYGYSFGKAEEDILKFGEEEKRAAVLAKVVGESVGGMNKALAKTTAGAIKQLSAGFGDIWATMGQRLEPATKKFAVRLAELTKAAVGWMSIPTVQKMTDERVRANLLAKQLSDLNKSEDERRRILNELKNINPDIVRGINAEKVETEKLVAQLRKYNEVQLKRIFLQKKQEEIDGHKGKSDEAREKSDEAIGNIHVRAMDIIANAKKINPGLAEIVEDAFFGKYWDAENLDKLLSSDNDAWRILRLAGFGNAKNDKDMALAELNAVAELARRTGQVEAAIKMSGRGLLTDLTVYLSNWSRSKYHANVAKSLETEINSFAKRMGVKLPSDDAGDSSGNSSGGLAEDIITGGKRVTDIKITIGNLVEQLFFNKENSEQNFSDMENRMLDLMMRVINMAQSAAM